MEALQKTEEALVAHCRSYPRLQITDIFKFLYQSAYGCEHLISDPEQVTERIRAEALECREHPGALTEALDGAFCRVHLDYIRKGMDPRTLGRLFCLSAEPVPGARKQLEQKLEVFLKLADQGRVPFAPAAVREAIQKWREQGYPACRHSGSFHEHYAPAYRLVKKEYALYLELLLRLDRMLAERGTFEQSRILLAVEGGSASGKTTLGRLLEVVYGCNVFHMDDFFLRQEQRTKERLEEPGGNVDRERFLKEVLLPLREGREVSYQRFDCGTGTLQAPVKYNPVGLCVVEGAYSMHPLLAEYYDLSVFLVVSPELQRARILKRNTPEFAERFFHTWIPMEKCYFEAYDVSSRCDLTVEAAAEE